MRKEINSKSKRKWVAGGLAAFASVALLTTGFATWVVINNNVTDSKDIGVTVDTASNESVDFKMTLAADVKVEFREQKKISKTETVDSTEGKHHIMATENDSSWDQAKNPLSFQYTGMTITYGKDYSEDNFSKIVFSIGGSSEADTYIDNNVSDSNIKLSAIEAAKSARTGENFTYFEAPKEITVTDEMKKNAAAGTNGTKVISLPASTLEFQWGSFFGNQSPANFYNTKFDSLDEGDTKRDIRNAAYAELDAMEAQFRTKDSTAEKPSYKKIKLVATLTK